MFFSVATHTLVCSKRNYHQEQTGVLAILHSHSTFYNTALRPSTIILLLMGHVCHLMLHSTSRFPSLFVCLYRHVFDFQEITVPFQQNIERVMLNKYLGILFDPFFGEPYLWTHFGWGLVHVLRRLQVQNHYRNRVCGVTTWCWHSSLKLRSKTNSLPKRARRMMGVLSLFCGTCLKIVLSNWVKW